MATNSDGWIERRDGWSVVAEAADGLEAVQKAQELKPDLILLDINLPNLNGIEAASRIRQGVPEARIIFVTLITDEKVARAALNCGAKGYLVKADAGTELFAALTAVLGGDDYVSSGVKGLGNPRKG